MKFLLRTATGSKSHKVNSFIGRNALKRWPAVWSLLSFTLAAVGNITRPATASWDVTYQSSGQNGYTIDANMNGSVRYGEKFISQPGQGRIPWPKDSSGSGLEAFYDDSSTPSGRANVKLGSAGTITAVLTWRTYNNELPPTDVWVRQTANASIFSDLHTRNSSGQATWTGDVSNGLGSPVVSNGQTSGDIFDLPSVEKTSSGTRLVRIPNKDRAKVIRVLPLFLDAQCTGSTVAPGSLYMVANTSYHVSPLSNLTLTAESDHIEAGTKEKSVIRVVALDTNGNPKSNAVVSLSTTAGTLLNTTLTTDASGTAATTLTTSDAGQFASVMAQCGTQQVTKHILMHRVNVSANPKIVFYDPSRDASDPQASDLHDPPVFFTITDAPTVAKKLNVTVTFYKMTGHTSIASKTFELQPGTYTKHWSDFFQIEGQSPDEHKTPDPGKGIYAYQVDARVASNDSDALELQGIEDVVCHHSNWKASKSLVIENARSVVHTDEVTNEVTVECTFNVTNRKHSVPPAELLVDVYNSQFQKLTTVPATVKVDPTNPKVFQGVATLPFSSTIAEDYYLVVEARQQDAASEGKDRNKWALEQTCQSHWIDLRVDDVPESTEESVGSWVVVNEHFDEENLNEKGRPVDDNEPAYNPSSQRLEDHIVPTDPDLCPAELEFQGLGSGPTKWKLQFPDNIKIWKRESDGTYSQVEANHNYDAALSEKMILKIEGIEEKEDREVEIEAILTRSTGEIVSSDSTKVTVFRPNLEKERVSSTDSSPEARTMSRTTTTQVSVDDADDTGEYIPDEDFEPMASDNAGGGGIGVAMRNAVSAKANKIRVLDFPPLMRHLNIVRRVTTISLPGPVGEDITWTAGGVAKISNASNGVYKSSVHRTLSDGGVSSVFFKTSGPGLLQIKIFNSKGRQILDRSTTVFNALRFSESDHLANHVPNEKWKTSYDFKRQPNFVWPTNKEEWSNVLWVSAEPEDGKVHLTLSTTLKRTPKWCYVWLLQGNKVEYGMGGNQTVKRSARGRIDPDGTAEPIIPSPMSYGDIFGSEGYKLRFGVGRLVKGKLTNVYYTMGYQYPYEVRTFTAPEIQSRVGYLEAVAWMGNFTNIAPFASAVTRVFLNEEVDDSAYAPTNQQAPRSRPLNAFSGSDFSNALTHIAGAHFTNDVPGTGSIPRFIWGPMSAPATEFAWRSSAAYDLITNMIKAHKADIEARVKSANGPINYDFNFSTQDLTFADHKSDSDDLDLFNALGHVGFRNGKIHMVVKPKNGSVSIQLLRIRGSILDLTDFDYTGEPPSNPAAIVQIGWEPHPGQSYSRPQGRIFYSQVNVDTTFRRPANGPLSNENSLDGISNGVGW